jgi:hypothetical protein
MGTLRASDFDRSKYLRAADLEEEARFKIKSVTEEVVGQGVNRENKLVLWFSNDQRGLVLNKTNIRILAPILGDDTREWAGAIITVYPTTTEMQGKIVPCLRVKPPKVAAVKPDPEPAPEPKKPSLRDELNDDLPI